MGHSDMTKQVRAKYFRLPLTILTLLVTVCACAPIPYSKGPAATKDENAVLQKLVPAFASDMKCEIGSNTLLKWNVQPHSAKFSIAWKKQCGPVIGGQYQLGDEGRGSTFVCQTTDKTCCWPLGYDYAKQWVVCSK